MKAAAGAAAMAGWLAACVPPAPPSRSADELATGERAWRRCHACHALEPGANTPAGPTLYRIVGRTIAIEPNFNYSPAMRRLAAAHGRWTPERLDRFLADPAEMAPGTEMGFVGLTNPAERQALIAWLEARQQRP